jgi:transposase
MQKNITKLLNLQGVLVGQTEFSEDGKQLMISCRGARRSASCPVCGVSCRKIHQTKERMIKHGMINYCTVILKLKVRRFKCKACAKVFTEAFPGIDRRRSSVNLIMQAMDWLRRNSFNFTGEQFGMSPATLVRYLLKMSGSISIDWAIANVTKLGIDEHSFRGKHLIITITDLSNKKLLAILKSDSQAELDSPKVVIRKSR